MTAALCRSVTSTCDSRARDARLGSAATAISRAASSPRARRRHRAAGFRRGEAVDDRQIEIGVLRPVLVDHRAALVDEIELRRSIRPIADRLAARRPITSIVDGSERRNAASRTHGDASSRSRHASRSVHTMFSPRSPSSTASTSPLDSRSLPRTTMSIDLQHAGVRRRPRRRGRPRSATSAASATHLQRRPRDAAATRPRLRPA